MLKEEHRLLKERNMLLMLENENLSKYKKYEISHERSKSDKENAWPVLTAKIEETAYPKHITDMKRSLIK